jgi:hypothetical protein
VAVNVTVWSKADGFALEVRTEVVAPWFTVSTSAAEVLALKFASPAYTTVME